MNRKYRLSTALDVDDLLMECTGYAIRLAYGKFPDRPYDSKAVWADDSKIRKILDQK